MTEVVGMDGDVFMVVVAGVEEEEEEWGGHLEDPITVFLKEINTNPDQKRGRDV